LDNLIAIVDVNRLGQSQATMYGHNLAAYEERFKAAGWRTMVIDGHDMNQIVRALDDARAAIQPTAIVARTIKGKGVSFIEDKDGWHGKPLKKGEETERALNELDGGHPSSPIGRLNLAEPPASPKDFRRAAATPLPMPSYSLGDQIATREAYGTALSKLGAVNPLIVALDGDTKNSTFSERFLKDHPDRFFEGFIAEQNMVGVAVGLAARGYIPFASTFACFLTRAFDQIRMAGVSQANIKLCGSHSGVSIGEDGPSQMGLEDLAMMRTIPGSIVLYPTDAASAERAVQLAAEHRGIAYVRTTRPKAPVLYSNDEPFEIGKCKVLRHSATDKLTIVAGGITIYEALKAYEHLKAENISVRIIDLFSVKPIDHETLVESASATGGWILTVEDHYSEGGLGEAVASAVSNEGIRVVRLAVTELPRSGKAEELLDRYGISAGHIIAKTKQIIGQKSA
jgi:transketolase